MSFKHLNRRDFISSSAVALTTLAASGQAMGQGEDFEEQIQRAVQSVGQLPRRRFDSSGREFTILSGAATWQPQISEAGLRCGINYWHKAQRWELRPVQEPLRPTPPQIIKDREAHYCQVCVDRIGGNHEVGKIDEESHYQFVKEAIKRTGLGYFDDMAFHFGYHTVEEYRTNKAFIRAYDRLKKEKLVRHLCLTQHNYNGNAKVPDGQSAAEILSVIIEDGLYEHAQFFYSYGEDEAISSFVETAREKGFGTVAMKVTRGAPRMQEDPNFMKQFPAGTTPHQALTRWLTTSTKIGTAVIGLRNLEQFADTYSGAGKAMRSQDTEAIRSMTAYADRQVCRLCNRCMEYCPQRIPISDILRYERYAVDYGEVGDATYLYAQLEKNAQQCAACKTCLPHCPQGLEIPRRLAEAHSILIKKRA